MKIATLFKRSLSVILTIAILLSMVCVSTAYVVNAQSNVELQLTVGCYDSRSNSKLTTGTTTANKYVATQIFTKEDLPNGTQIIVDSGYKYRPDGWVELDQKNTTRPSNVTGASTVTVTDAWWGDFKYRAFNISKSTETDMTGKESEVAAHFRIILPSQPEEDDDTINILAIGNSFSKDALHYAEQIAAEFGYKTKFLNLYASGCSLETHWKNYQSNAAAYDLQENYSTLETGVTMQEVLEGTDFDYITFQQASGSSPTYSTYHTTDNPYLLNLYNAVKEYQPNAQYLIHQTWSYYSEKAVNDFSGKYDDANAMFTALEASYNRASELLGGLPIIKSGKAVENAKNAGYLSDHYNTENPMYADSMAHLSDKGDFLTGLVWVETLFGVDVTTKDFTSIFEDADNLCKAAHSAVNGQYSEYINTRGENLRNSYLKIKSGEKINVVYYGGSVTNGTGASDLNETSWRGRVENWLTLNYPSRTSHYNKAIGSTGSKFGVYRLEKSVLAQNPDLIFIDFAINDKYNYDTEKFDVSVYSTRFETIIRTIRNRFPDCDIVTLLTTDKNFVNTNQEGELHAQAQAHEEICEKYNIPSIHVGRALADKLPKGSGSTYWSEYSGDSVHPNDKGYQVYYDVLIEYMNNYLLNGDYEGTVQNHTLPNVVNDYLIDGNMQTIDVSQELLDKSVSITGNTNFQMEDRSGAWNYVTDKNVAMTKDTSADAIFGFEFTGTEVAMLDGTNYLSHYEVTVDGVNMPNVTKVEQPTVLATGLKYGKHTVTVKPVFTKTESSYFYVQSLFIRNEDKASSRHIFDRKVATAQYKAANATETTKALYYLSCECGEAGRETFEYGEVADVTVKFVADGVEIASCQIENGETLPGSLKNLEVPDKAGYTTKKWMYKGEELDWDMWFTEDAVIEAVYSNEDPEPTQMVRLEGATPTLKADGSAFSSNNERGLGVKLDLSKLESGKKYTISFKYHIENRAINAYRGVGFYLFGQSSTTSYPFNTMLFTTSERSSRGTLFSDFGTDGTNATMSFTLSDVSAYKNYYFGVYFENQYFDSSLPVNSTPYVYLADIKVVAEDSEENAAPTDLSSATWGIYQKTTAATSYVSVTDYDESIFKGDKVSTRLRRRSDGTGEETMVYKLPANTLKPNVEYTITLKHHGHNRKVGFYNNTVTGAASLIVTGANTGSTSILRGRYTSSSYKYLTTESNENTMTATFSFTEEQLAKYTSYQIGFYFEKVTTTPSYIYLGDIQLYETNDTSKTNLLPKDMRKFSWRAGAADSTISTDDVSPCIWGSGDYNLDGSLDIRDLVGLETRMNGTFNPGSDMDYDLVLDDKDIDIIRKTLLGVLEQGFEGQKKSTHSSTRTVNLGDEITYSIKVKNITNKTQNAKVTDILPECVEFVNGDGNVIGNKFTWGGEVEAGKSKTITYTVKVKDDASYSGSVLSGSNATVNGYAIDGYDLYVARTLASEDKRYISNGIRALRDSTYRDMDYIKWTYYIAFTQSVMGYFGETAEATLNSLLDGTASEDTLGMIAPTLYGGNLVDGQISGVKGSPANKVLKSSLVVGDVLFVKSGDTVKNYIYDVDGFVDMSKPIEDVDTTEILDSLSASDIFAVFRPVLVHQRDYIVEDEFKELDLTPQQEAVIATAESYLLRGEKLQYADKTFGNSSSTEYRWTPNKYAPRNPEYTSRDEWGYTNCAGFTYEVYQTALGINISNSGGTAINQTARWETYAEGRGMVAYKWPENPNTLSETEKEQAKKEFLEVLQPGDLFLLRRASGSGHIMLYVGNGSFIHSGGSVYNFDEYKEVYEPSIRYHRVEDYFFTPSSTTNYLFGDNIGVFWVCRPLARADYNVEVPQQTMNRINNMEGIVAQKLSSHNSGETANRGENITYTFEIYNAGYTAKTVDICDTVPANTTYVSGADTVNGDKLSWKVTVPANKRVSVSYTVTVNDDVAYGTAIQTTDTSTVGGVKTICPKVYVNNTLTATEQSSVVDAINTVKTNGTSNTKFALVNEIYKTAGLTTEDIFDTEFLTVLEGESGTFKPAAKSDGTAVSGFYSLNDVGNKYRDMLAPTLYGGKKIYQQDRERRTDRSRLVRPHHLMTGDVLIRRDGSAHEQMFIYDGNKFINLTSGIEDDTITVQRRMEYAMGSVYYYAIYRPSFSLQ